MEVLDKRVQSRREMFQFYVNLFQDFEGVKVFQEPDEHFFSNHWLSVVTIDKSLCGVSREDVRICLEKENIESRPLWKPMHLQPVFSEDPFYGTGIAEEMFENGLCLPSGSNLSDEDRSRIKTAILNCFKK